MSKALLPRSGLEVEGIDGGLGFVGAAGVADGVAVGPLAADGEAAAEAAMEGGLERVVVVGAAAGLVVDLGEAVAELRAPGARAGGGVHGDAGDEVGPGAQEQVAALAADVGDGEDSAAGQFLLEAGRVGEDLLRESVAGRIGAGLEAEVGIVDVVVR